MTTQKMFRAHSLLTCRGDWRHHCLLCPMLGSKLTEENVFAVDAVHHVVFSMNTISLILSFN